MKNTYHRLLQEGLNIASLTGLDAITIGTLATRANLSKSGVFAHFRSHEELLSGPFLWRRGLPIFLTKGVQEALIFFSILLVCKLDKSLGLDYTYSRSKLAVFVSGVTFSTTPRLQYSPHRSIPHAAQESHTMANPSQPSSLQHAHAVFAGGGVRGIAHVGALEVAEQLGYRWQHVAGTSAGAIIAALVAAGYNAQELRAIMQEIDYSRFASKHAYDLLHLTEMSNIFTRGGLHDGSYIETFIDEKLRAKGVHTFGDLLLQGQEQQLDLFQRYRLTVIVSDITQGRIVRLPQDAHLYGIDPNALHVACAVRMSASIPFFFIPLQLTDANGVRSCIVDGGLLSNFPLFLFEHAYNLQDSALPTFGFQLVDTSQRLRLGNNGNESKVSNESNVLCGNESNIGNESNVPCSSESNIDNKCNVPCGINMLKALISTMLSAHDRLYIDDQTFAHTIAIPTHGIASTQFDLTREQAQQLYESGKTAAATFFKTWNFEAYTATYRSGNNPGVSRQAQIHHAMKQHLRSYSSCNDV